MAKEVPKFPSGPPAVNAETSTQGNVVQSKRYAAPAALDASGAPTTKVLPERAREYPNASPEPDSEAAKRGEASVQEVLLQVNIWTNPVPFSGNPKATRFPLTAKASGISARTMESPRGTQPVVSQRKKATA